MTHQGNSDKTLPLNRGDSESGSLCVLIGAEGKFTTHPLPERGELSIGREAGNTFVVNHPSVSRRHAVLRLGPDLEIEDLGGTNGVRVQGQVIPRHGRARVRLGDVIELGETILMVRRTTVASRARRLWPHGYFEGRVEEQCARAKRSAETFAVLRVNLETTLTPPTAAMEEALAAMLREHDVLALYAPGEYEILLVDSTPEEAEQVSRRLHSHLERLGTPVRLGLALYPRDGSAPETTIARACDAVRGLERVDSVGDGPSAGTGLTMRRLRQLTEQVAASDLNVLILGETGVGKEVLAETVHRLSQRGRGPFVKLHCAAFSDSLLESELFGHEKGAFTGAHQAKPGLLESAQGGSVLLDEIGELQLATQVKLLRVLEDRKVLRIGALTPRSIDLRFIAATNRDLEAEVAMGRFRPDLYYRLNGVSLVVPPLRERADEIELLARSFITQACRRMGRRDEPALSTEALERLHTYSWPGNIRELRNTVERATLLCGRGPILTEHLPTEKMGATMAPGPTRPRDLFATPPPSSAMEFDFADATIRVPRPPSLDPKVDPFVALERQRDALERQKIMDTLEQCAGNQTRAAKMLGISRGTFLARLDAYGIPRPRARKPTTD